MGRVWRAADEMLDREVAVKEMRIDGLDAEDARTRRERSLREARATARIDHPGVVRIYDVVDAGERLWIVMELVAGRSLERLTAEEGPLGPRETARIGLGLIAALRQVHARGVLHRDIKPGNVLVEDGGRRVVLTDFGIAAIQDTEALTMVGMLVGSPDYMAPERISGRPQGPSSDVWSLAATLCAALSGHSPFSRDTTLSTLHAVLYESPELPSNAGPLREILTATLHKDPALRADLNTLRSALHPVAFPPPTPTLPVNSPGPGLLERGEPAHWLGEGERGLGVAGEGERGLGVPGDGERGLGAPGDGERGLGAPGAGALEGVVPGTGPATPGAGPPGSAVHSEEEPAPGVPPESGKPAPQPPEPGPPGPGEPAPGRPARGEPVSEDGPGPSDWREPDPGQPAPEVPELRPPGRREPDPGQPVPGEPVPVGSVSEAPEPRPPGWRGPDPATGEPEPAGFEPVRASEVPVPRPPDPRQPEPAPERPVRSEPDPRQFGSAQPGGSSEVTPPHHHPGVSLARAQAVTEHRAAPPTEHRPAPPSATRSAPATGLPDAPDHPRPHAAPEPRPPRTSRSPSPHGRRTALLAAAGVLAAGGVAAIVWVAVPGAGGGDDRAGPSPRPRTATTAPATPGHSPTAATTTPGGSPTTNPSPTVEGTYRPPSLPAGVRQEAGGYAWATPVGWRRDVMTGAEVHYTSPDGTQELVAKSSLARGDLMETWRTSERNAHQGQGYRKIRLEETTFRGRPAVVWEYTFTLQGTPWHAVLLGFEEEGKTYQINTWYQPAVEPGALQTYEKVKDSFTVLSTTRD
ncbi:protein kinase [Streptomyces sp. NPDC002328]|uniref:serine/threonine-protein kinase n=1 Tax=Streptomyces sp. NPDC002328 TaxID=3364642 RepID=UPI0036CAE6FB